MRFSLSAFVEYKMTVTVKKYIMLSTDYLNTV